MKSIVDIKAALCLTLVALAPACAGSARLGGAENVTVLPSSELPPSAPQPNTSPHLEYTLGAYDKLSIEFLGLPDLALKEVMVDVNGSISVPVAGSISVIGLTPAELEQTIEARLSANYFRNPDVTVNVIEVVSHFITVDGQVRQPGQYPVAPGATLMRSVALAEGVNDNANTKDVVVFRAVDGKRYAALYNLAAIRRGRYSDPPIYANDIVMVGDAQSKRLFKDLLTAVPAILTPIVILLTQ